MDFEDCDSPFPCLVINNDRDNLKVKSTTLCVLASATGTEFMATSQDKSGHLLEWSEEITKSCIDARSGSTSRLKALILRSSLHDKEAGHHFALPNQHLGINKNSFKLPTSGFGEIHFSTGYWEWTEDILSHHKEALHHVDIYYAVHASLFTYICNKNVLQAFLEIWCPSTNTLHTDIGELSISLWDLRGLCGLPIRGEFYDEVIPSAKELMSDDSLPRSCKFLFSAFHQLPKESNTIPTATWINFWFRGSIRYAKPPLRSSQKRTVKPRLLRNPSGIIDPSHPSRNEAYDEPFKLLEIDEGLREETYLAAFLSCWLCKFVLPHRKIDCIRPTIFKVASRLARGGKTSLAIPTLTSIYRGLRDISSSTDLTESAVTFPIHYLYAWIGCYLPTYFTTNRILDGASMIKYGGENMAKHFEQDEARDLFRNINPSTLKTLRLYGEHQTSVVDEQRISRTYKDLFVTLRSSYLTLRLGPEHIVEAYSPHRFGRQFGFCQDIPGNLKRTITTCDLPELIRLWNSCTLLGTSSKLTIPGETSSPPLATKSYVEWWTKCRATFLKQSRKFTVKFKPIMGSSPTLCQPAHEETTSSQSRPASQTHGVNHCSKDVGSTRKEIQPSLQKSGISEPPNKNASGCALKRKSSKLASQPLPAEQPNLVTAVIPSGTPQSACPERNEVISALFSSDDEESIQYQLTRRPKVSDLDNLSIPSNFFEDVPSASMPLEELVLYLANLENQTPPTREGSVNSVNGADPLDFINKDTALEACTATQPLTSTNGGNEGPNFSKHPGTLVFTNTASLNQPAAKKLKQTLKAPTLAFAAPDVSEFCPQAIKSEAEQMLLKFTWNRIYDKISKTPLEHLSLIRPKVDELVKQMRDYMGDTSSLETHLQHFFDGASNYTRVKSDLIQKQSKDEYEESLLLAQQNLCEFEARETDIIKGVQILEDEYLQLAQQEDELKKQLARVINKKEETSISLRQAEEDVSKVQAEITIKREEIAKIESTSYWSDREVEALNKMEALLTESRQDLASGLDFLS